MASSERLSRAKASDRRDAVTNKAKQAKKTQAKADIATRGNAAQRTAKPKAAAKPAKPTASLADAEKEFDSYLKAAGRGQASAEADVDAELAAYRAAAKSK
jgi:hypothetical protein